MTQRTVLFLLFCAATAFAWPAVRLAERGFVETFAAGFDHPGVALVAENVVFDDGVLRLVEGTAVEYAFDYAPIESAWGTRDPFFGGGRVAVVDAGDPAASLTVTWTVGFYELEGTTSDPSQIVFTLSGSEGRIALVNPPDVAELGAIEDVTFSREAGQVLLELRVENPFSGAWPVVRHGATSEEAMLLTGGFVLVPLRVRIEGRGFDVDEIQLETYDIVGEASASFGAVKSRFAH